MLTAPTERNDKSGKIKYSFSDVMADMTACDTFDLSFCEILYPVNWDPFGKDIILEKFAVRYDMMDCADASLNCENEQQLRINQSVEFTLSHPVISFVISNIQQGTKLI